MCNTSNIVQVANSIDKQPLSFIDEKLIEAGEFLQLLQNNSKRLYSLTVFTQCKNIINWIRSDTKGKQIG